MIYDSILGTIGETPTVRAQRLAPKHLTMYVKCAFFNPGHLSTVLFEGIAEGGDPEP